MLPGSAGPSLSGGDGRAGEGAGAARRLEAEGVGRGGGGGRHPAGAAQVSVVELPYQLLVLHRQTLVHLGLLLQGLLQHGLLAGQLPVGDNQGTTRDIRDCSDRLDRQTTQTGPTEHFSGY